MLVYFDLILKWIELVFGLRVTTEHGYILYVLGLDLQMVKETSSQGWDVGPGKVFWFLLHHGRPSQQLLSFNYVVCCTLLALCLWCIKVCMML